MKLQKRHVFVLGVFCYLFCIVFSNAIVLKLKNGNPLEGKLVSIEEGKITFDVNGMQITLSKDRIIPPDTEWLQQANDFFNNADYNKAIEYCNQLLIWDPDNVKTKELLTQSRKKADEAKFAKEQEAFEKKGEEMKKAAEKAKAEDNAKTKEEEDKKKPNEIFQKISDTYKNLSTYYFEFNFNTEIVSPALNQSMVVPVVLVAVNPNKIHLETKSELIDMLIISDGTTKWMSLPGMNQYCKVPADKNLSGKDQSLEAAMDGVNILAGLANKIKNTEILREDYISYGDSSVQCYVVRAELQNKTDTNKFSQFGGDPGPITFWVDENQYRVMKVVIPIPMKEQMMGIKITLLFKKIRLNEPLPNDLFVFTPPAEAEEVSMDSFGKNFQLPLNKTK